MTFTIDIKASPCQIAKNLTKKKFLYTEKYRF